METLPPVKNRNFLGKILDTIADIAGFMSMAAIVFAMLIIVYEVMVRYLLKLPTVWEVEAAIMATIFATFIGSVFALKNNAHITMGGIVLPSLKPTVNKWLAVITSILAFMFLLILGVKSWQMFWEAYSSGWRSETLWGPRLAIPYSFLAIGVSIMCLQYIAIIATAIKSLRSEVDNG